MALDGSEVRLGVTGHLYKAPVGTAFPADVSTAPAATWVELGYTETGPSVSVDTNKESFTPWQSFSPVREQVTEQTITATFTLWQRNIETLQLAWGGGTVSGTAPNFIYTPPSVATVNELAFIFEINDGAVIDRFCISRASAALNGDVAFAKDAVTGYEIELTYLQPVTGSAWQLLSNDPALDAA